MKVLLAPGRAGRPGIAPQDAGNDVDPPSEAPAGRAGKREEGSGPPAPSSRNAPPDCPLCAGHELETPPETYAVRPEGGPPDSEGWLVRSVPNKYPVLTEGHQHAPIDPLGAGRGDPELFSSYPAVGGHEVIIHSPQHAVSLAELDVDQFARAVEGWQARTAAHASAPYVHLSVNEGREAGASLPHTHAQLYALPFVPALVARERERFTAHHNRTMGGCLLCDLLQEEVRRRDRVVAIDDHAVLIAPYASRMPFELQLIPRAHARTIVESSPASAVLLLNGLVRLRRLLGAPPPLNLWVRNAPRDAEHFHWRIDILPRTTQLAGLELGTGVAVNIYPPEQAAADLRVL
jgi:UDPglucose--hexose-1-phosphate uridylyltransferase